MPRLEHGFVYLWALFSVVLAGIVMAGTGQMWQTKSQREKEAELMFIGEEFRKAIMSYHNSGTKQYPESLEDLLKDDRSPNVKRHLRKIYVDPITNTTEWGLVAEPPPNTGSTAANKGSAQNQSSAQGQSSTQKQGTTPNQNLAPNQSSAAANTGSTPTASTGAGANATAANSSAPASSSSGISSGIGKKIIGVYSLSANKPIKKDHFPEHFAKFSEALTYQDWQFVYKPDSKTPGAAGATPAKPGASSTPSASPFSPQSSSGSSGAATKNSPFSPQSAPTGGSKAPATGFPDDD
ncbi:type II secretory pathway pseudopilin PulG [Nitrosomonas sp. Nm84]|uniref:type II secretion system protein n=1 Tax=Nitrosomonas sp. Nm84 TaxID=200124 RepID=UPI000D772A88|nr:type II secretion system protein [Nitrosomonas sp. Nm84]PXW88949.1 type II secretory pathway pseudopilin PulG [Nitrosomonas sp. Nm84]